MNEFMKQDPGVTQKILLMKSNMNIVSVILDMKTVIIIDS